MFKSDSAIEQGFAEVGQYAKYPQVYFKLFSCTRLTRQD